MKGWILIAQFYTNAQHGTVSTAIELTEIYFTVSSSFLSFSVFV